MTAAIFGATGGIGSALAEALAQRRSEQPIFALSRSGRSVAGAAPIAADALDEAALAAAATRMSEAGPLTLCVVAIGVLSDGDALRPERTYRQQSRPAFEQTFLTNAIAPALIAKHILPVMARDQRSVFAVLSARIGSIADNRLGGWHAYRASKAALNMLIKNYAIEQVRRCESSIIVGLHPGTVDTPLSKPFQNNVPAERLFGPSQSAAYLLDVIENLTPADSGKVFDWAGKEIPA